MTCTYYLFVQHQKSFAQSEFERKKKVTRREKFLADMERVVPWIDLIALIEPFYPKGERGRPPVGLERIFRIYLLQLWYSLADEALEDAIYDSQSLRTFTGINLSCENVPDATTLLRFRRLLEENQLQTKILATINERLTKTGLMMKEGTIVDATIIAAPSSTKNKKRERDPEMHQTKKGNEWHFGMKAHIGVDMDSGLVHSVVATAANVSDVTCAAEVLHGEEKTACADAGYTGVNVRPEVLERHGSVNWIVAQKRGKIEALPEGEIKTLSKQLEYIKAQVRAKVEHPFNIIKNVFRFRKVTYRGLAKNAGRLEVLFALANLLICRESRLEV